MPYLTEKRRSASVSALDSKQKISSISKVEKTAKTRKNQKQNVVHVKIMLSARVSVKNSL